MQRIAISLISVVAIAATGCVPPGGPGRRMVGNSAMPASRSFATPMQGNPNAADQQSARDGTTDPRQALQQMVRNSPRVGEKGFPGQHPSASPMSGIATGQGQSSPTPVIAADRMPAGRPASATQQQITDQTAGSMPPNTRPDGTIGLPQFRLPEMGSQDRETQTQESGMAAKGPVNPAPAPASPAPSSDVAIVLPGEQSGGGDSAGAAENGVSRSAVATTSAVADAGAGSAGDLPVANPIPAVESLPIQSGSRINQASAVTDLNPAIRQLNAPLGRIPGSESSPSGSSSAESPSAGQAISMPGKATMQVQVIDESAGNPSAMNSSRRTAPAAPSATAGQSAGAGSVAAAAASSEKTPGSTLSAGAVANSEPQRAAPASFALPPLVGKLAKNLSSQVLGSEKNGVGASTPAVAASETAVARKTGNSASAAGIRVDPNLRSPWSQPVSPGSPVSPSSTGPSSGSASSGVSGSSAPFSLPGTPNRIQLKAETKAQPQTPDLGSTAGAERTLDAAVLPAAFEAPSDVVGAPPVVTPPPMLVGPNLPAGKSGSPFSLPSNAVPSAKDPVPGAPAGRSEEKEAAPSPSLRVPTAALTTEIRGFGQYLPLKSDRLRPGQTVLLYCELENHVAVPSGDAKDVSFTTLLDTHLTVRDAGGRVVQEQDFPRLADTSRSRRNDFYLYVPVTLGDLAPGSYQAQLRVSDIHGRASTDADPVTFQIR